jgi:hypothetical protein
MHRMSNSLGWVCGCSDLLRYRKTGSKVRSYSGPEVKIWGREREAETKKPQPGLIITVFDAVL